MGDAALVHTHNQFFLAKLEKYQFFQACFPDAKKKKKWPHLFFGEKKKKKKKKIYIYIYIYKKPCLPHFFPQNGLRNNCIFFLAYLPSSRVKSFCEYRISESYRNLFFQNFFVFSSPVRKYRKSYCSHPGVGVGVGVSVGVGVAQNVKVFG